MKKFDVVIIGAGPGGLKCAEILANSKLKVLLLEKNKIIGPKVCAGGLTKKCLKYVNDFPNKLLDYNYRRIKFYTPLNYTLLKSDDFLVCTINRRNFGQWQLNKINNFKNIIIKTDTKVTKINKDYIITNNKEKFQYKFLVGADGSNSVVRRHLGLKIDSVNIALQYKILTNKYKELEVFYNSKSFYSWYAWIFPHKDYASVGCVCDPKYFPPKKLKDNFKNWLQDNNIDISNAKYQVHTINYDYKGYKFGNIFLVGDAAGLASGFTGEGIYQALVSGEEIAKVILDKNYIPDGIEKLLKGKRIHNLILKILIKSGFLRPLLLESINLLLKNRRISNLVTNIVS